MYHFYLYSAMFTDNSYSIFYFLYVANIAAVGLEKYPLSTLNF